MHIIFNIDGAIRMVAPAGPEGAMPSSDCLTATAVKDWGGRRAPRSADATNVAHRVLDDPLEQADLDPRFLDLLTFCALRRLAVSIVSEEVDSFVYRLLERHRWGHLPVFAARGPAARGGPMKSLFGREGCAAGSGVCKCLVAGAWSEPKWSTTVYVGHARSDICVSARVDLLFAAGELADLAKARGRTVIPYATFDVVREVLKARLSSPAPVTQLGRVSDPKPDAPNAEDGLC